MMFFSSRLRFRSLNTILAINSYLFHLYQLQSNINFKPSFCNNHFSFGLIEIQMVIAPLFRARILCFEGSCEHMCCSYLITFQHSFLYSHYSLDLNFQEDNKTQTHTYNHRHFTYSSVMVKIKLKYFYIWMLLYIRVVIRYVEVCLEYHVIVLIQLVEVDIVCL